MIPFPFKLVTIASLSLLAVPACTNEPVKKKMPVAKVASYTHAERQQAPKAHNARYISQYKQAQITAKPKGKIVRPAYTQRASYTQHTPRRQVRPAATQQRHRKPRAAAPVRKVNHRKSVFAVKATPRRPLNLKQTWREVHQGFRLRDYSHKKRVQRYIRSYARMPERMIQLNRRSAKYLPSIIAEVKRRGMPTEIALLPFVESAFQHDAYSPAHAAGLWQFIPETARRYGIPVSPRYDGRYNWQASTKAALDYLQDLNREFNGDWLLSLAAYNCGEARVHREIARNRARGLPTDFWNLRLPKETRHYVPRLLAFKEIYGNPSAHGIHIAYIPENPKMARTHYLLTANKSGKVYSRKSKRYSEKRARKYKKRIVTHKVRSGETLTHIARRYRTSVRKIMRLNGLKSTRIKAGKRLRIATSKRRYYG